MHIYRIDSDRSHTHAWVVTISRRKKKFAGHFSDGVYGGKQKALAAARRYRKAILLQYPPMELKKFCAIVMRNNRSGISGVCRCASPRKNGELYWNWVASWSPEPGTGKTRQKKFPVAKYGEEGAFKRAVQARRKMLAQVQGEFVPDFRA